MHEDVLQTRNITIDVDAPAGVYGYFDRDLVMGVIGTIINNAYRDARSPVLLDVREAERYLRISVIDDGPGYPDTMWQNAGEHVAAVSFEIGRSGLGLYFATVIAQAHRNKDRHGRVEVSNEGIDDGGKFSLYLP